jgi:hypothetical protein
MKTPQNKRLHFQVYSSSLLAHLNRGKKDTIFPRHIGIKVRGYGTHVGKNIAKLGNIMGTYWELEGNIHWEARKND